MFACKHSLPENPLLVFLIHPYPSFVSNCQPAIDDALEKSSPYEAAITAVEGKTVISAVFLTEFDPKSFPLSNSTS